ncbi:MAG: plastocyanin [Gammaproteobacteria bacterium]|nr:MAG: plastocyanin [Gammaproteobacteria bacterium]
MIIINLLGFALMAFVVWWFWLYKPSDNAATVENGKITVLVENGVYNPASVKVAANTATEIVFIRKDASPCASTVVFGDLDISAELPQDKPQSVLLPALEKGEYAFTCQMQMYRGAIIVE